MDDATFEAFEAEHSSLDAKYTSLKKKIKEHKRESERITVTLEKDLAAWDKKVQLELTQLEAASKRRQEEVARLNADIIQRLQSELKKVTAECSDRQEQMMVLSHTRDFVEM